MSNHLILLIEDNPDDVLLTLHTLKKNDIHIDVVAISNGIEALDYLFGTGQYAGSPLPRLPDLVLLDLKLPKMSGLEVLHQLRAHPRTKCLPIVVLTTSNEKKDILESYKAGANSFIQKPVDILHFREVIRQIEQYWLHVNQRPPQEGTCR